MGKKKLTIIMDSVLRIKLNEISKEDLKLVKEKLTYSNPQYYKIRAMNQYAAKNIDQYVVSYEINKNEILISRGALKKLKSLLEDKYEFKINDNKITRKCDMEFKDKITPFEYQKVPIELGIENEDCILHGECGSGKTEIGLKITCMINEWTLIIVPTLELMTQWIERIKLKINNSEEILGQWGNGIKDLKPITIAIVNSANKDAEFLADKFGVVIVDEAHRSPSSIFTQVINKSKAKRRIALTATPYRKDGLQCLMFDQFGEIVSKITEEDLLGANRRMPVDVEIILTKSEMSEEEYGYNIYLDHIIKDKKRNRLIYNKLMENKEHYNLILTDRVEFARNWKMFLEKSGIPTGLMLGGSTNKAESMRTKKLIESGELHFAIGTTVADEGLDIPRLNRIYITTPTANNKRRIRQQRGRAGRPCEGKYDAKLYYFCDIRIDGAINQIRNIKNYLKESKIVVVNDGQEYEIKDFIKKFNNKQISI